MLEDAEREGNQDIVSWQSHGRCFRIHNEPEFVEKIMPRYFKAKVGSFRRWLRAWGFVRMTEDKDRGAWYHRYFIRGVTNLCKNMTRLQMLEAMENWLPVGQVPDFYSVSSKANLLLENPAVVVHADGTGLVKNPKRLRGTILEDIRQMLQETAEDESEKKIVSWMPHGRAFKVHQKDAFVKVIMPRYFKTAKLTHLSDTLRIWGFCRLKAKGPDKGAYFHMHFVRGDASLTRHLLRQQMKNAMANWPGPRGEPDLYVLPQTKVSGPTVQGQTPSNAAAAMPAEAIDPRAPMDPIDFLNLHCDPNAYQQQVAQSQANSIDPPSNSSTPNSDSIPNKIFKSNDSTYVMRYVYQLLILCFHRKLQRSQASSSSFNGRIHEMLENADKFGFQDIVSWQSHGRAFRIHKEAEFEEKIMPRYFKAKMDSFRRWLRAWGFVRMTEGRDRGAWYHRYFVRGVTTLCRDMSRLKMLKAMQNWLPVGQVPDFYSSGTGEAFSEAVKLPQYLSGQPPINPKNPKRLRGIVLEDLRKMLEDAEAENNTVVTWLKHGRAFVISNKQVFTESVLPRYFKAKKYTYFSDILRIWGFVRLKSAEDKGAYFHRLFVKGKPELTRHLSRQQMKQSMAGWPPKNGGEPNLYSPDVDRLVDECFATSSAPVTATTNTGGHATPALPILAPTANLIPVASSLETRGEKRKVDQMQTVEL
jgi:hypothetical protein